jgi:protein ImuB
MSSTAFSDSPTVRQTGRLYGSVHLPDFSVQAFIRNEPALRRQALVVLDGTFPLFTVVGANRAARDLGVRTGMTKLRIEQFSGLRIRYRSRPQEDATHRALLDCAHAFTPRVEETAVDTITLDLNGLSGLWGPPRAIAQKLLRSAHTLGLEAHVATASNPDAAVSAARSGAGITIIPPGEEAVRLRALPLGILDPPDAIGETLRSWGIRTFGDLAALPEAEVSTRLGPDGVALRRRALGAVERPLEAAREQLRFAEFMELEEPVESLEPLAFILSRLLSQLCRRLTARNLSTGQVRLALRLVPGKESETAFEREIRTPVPTREPKTLLKLLQLDLDAHRPPAPVAGVTLTASPVAPRRIQHDLFSPPAPEPEKLELTLARIGALVGSENIGAPALVDSHRPDAFRLRRFRVLPPSGRTPDRPGLRRPHSPAPAALRISRPPQPVTVEIEKGQPARLLFAGKTGRVVGCAGPWSSSGDWWRRDAWNREEWDVEVRESWRRTLYRIYRDPRSDCWYIDGTYD